MNTDILLQHSAWFQSLTSARQQQLLLLGQCRTLQAGSYLFSRGDRFDGIYAVLDGMIQISGINSAGKEALLTFIEPGDWFGEIALFDQQQRTHDAMAKMQSRLFHLSGTDLQNILSQDPAWWPCFGQLLTYKIRLVFQALEDIALQPASVRLARRLWLLCRSDGVATERMRIPISQEQLGQLLSLSRQTTNQLLQEMVRQHIVRLAYGEIEILDLKKLQQQAAETP